MIGLGSNRLTVCRRGGMSVTQAGRGGMEWLAGNGFRSPYSAQATAALKAQFPTQWPTILDYGFAHPEIVGYMNAYAPEDAKIAYSLVPNVGIRYIKSNGTNYVLTGLYPTQDMEVESYWYFETDSNPGWNTCGVYGSWNSDRGNADFSLRRFANASFAPSFPSLPSFVSYNFTPNQVEHLLHTMKGFWLNGEQKNSGNYTLNVSNRKEFAIFKVNNNSQGPNGKSGLVRMNFRQGGIEHILIPIKKDGANKVIDLYDGSIGTIIGGGTLTISESPS